MTTSLKDDDLAGRMGLQAKELNKLMAVLGNDRLVQVYVPIASLQSYLIFPKIPPERAQGRSAEVCWKTVLLH